jgi:hypothetical protein
VAINATMTLAALASVVRNCGNRGSVLPIIDLSTLAGRRNRYGPAVRPVFIVQTV